MQVAMGVADVGTRESPMIIRELGTCKIQRMLLAKVDSH